MGKLLKPKGKPKTRTLSFRVPAELAEQLDDLSAGADRYGLALDAGEAVQDALNRYCVAVEKELASMAAAQ